MTITLFLVILLQGALLLTEVLKERDAQIAFKNSRDDFQKGREKYLLEIQKQVRLLLFISIFL